MVCAEGGDVLLQLAVDHEGAVAREQMRHGSDGELARFIGVAEEKFAGGKWLPGFAVFGELAVAGLRLAVDAEVVGIAEAVGVAEVLDGAGSAVDDDGSGVLLAEFGGSASRLHKRGDFGVAGVDGGDALAVDGDPGVGGAALPHGVPIFGER